MTPHEIDAMGDVLDQIAAQAEAAPATSVPLYEALVKLIEHASKVKSLFETGLKNALEQPQVVGSKVYAVKPGGRWRPDHKAIRSNIISTAVLDLGTGELRDAADAARVAVELTYEVFVAEKTEPKAAGLAKVGFAKKRDACWWESTGKALVVTDLGFPEDAG